jgi:hypothetical protein
MRASHADREQVIDTLKVAFALGRLTKDELDVRVGQALQARTYAELAAVTAGVPAWPSPARPPKSAPAHLRRPANRAADRPPNRAVKPGVYAIAAATLAAGVLVGVVAGVAAAVIMAIFMLNLSAMATRP